MRQRSNNISAAFLFNGYNFIAAVFFTSIGEEQGVALVSCLRGLVLVIVFFMVLPAIFGEAGIWLATPLTEAVTFTVVYRLLDRFRKRLVLPD